EALGIDSAVPLGCSGAVGEVHQALNRPHSLRSSTFDALSPVFNESLTGIRGVSSATERSFLRRREREEGSNTADNASGSTDGTADHGLDAADEALNQRHTGVPQQPAEVSEGTDDPARQCPDECNRSVHATSNNLVSYVPGVSDELVSRREARPDEVDGFVDLHRDGVDDAVPEVGQERSDALTELEDGIFNGAPRLTPPVVERGDLVAEPGDRVHDPGDRVGDQSRRLDHGTEQEHKKLKSAGFNEVLHRFAKGDERLLDEQKRFLWNAPDSVSQRREDCSEVGTQSLPVDPAKCLTDGGEELTEPSGRAVEEVQCRLGDLVQDGADPLKDVHQGDQTIRESTGFPNVLEESSDPLGHHVDGVAENLVKGFHPGDVHQLSDEGLDARRDKSDRRRDARECPLDVANAFFGGDNIDDASGELRQ